MNDLSTAERIQVIAKRKDISISDISEGISGSPQTLYYRLRNDSWTLKILIQIAQILDVPVYDLIPAKTFLPGSLEAIETNGTCGAELG